MIPLPPINRYANTDQNVAHFGQERIVRRNLMRFCISDANPIWMNKTQLTVTSATSLTITQ